MEEDIRTRLGSRERQIIEAVYMLRKATVAEVREILPDPPSYSAVRAMLNLLESKGHIKRDRKGMRHVYSPVVAPQKAQKSALRHLISTFFNDSPTAAAAALLEMPEAKITSEEKDQLLALIEKAEREGK